MIPIWLKTTVSIVVVTPLLLVVGYIAYNELLLRLIGRARAVRTRRQKLSPKCYVCGELDYFPGSLERLIGKRWDPRRHLIRWRADVSPQRAEVQCWRCGATWAEMAISEKLSGIQPASWSFPQRPPQE